MNLPSTTFLIFLFFSFCQSIYSQSKIDTLNSPYAIQELLYKIDSKYKGFKIRKDLEFKDELCDNIVDSLKAKPWIKADFDNNGKTDMVTVGFWSSPIILYILDHGNENYEVNYITKGFFRNCAVPILKKEENQNKIELFYKRRPSYGESLNSSKINTKTLIYLFGDFIEDHKATPDHKIEKIEFVTSGCYGHCPIFEMTINSDKSAHWVAKSFNKIGKEEYSGKYFSTITDHEFQQIMELLNYLDFQHLKKRYTVPWTDDQSCQLKITYNGGKIKTIRDYGLIGTNGLNRLYILLFDLRKNQKWQR